MHGERSTTQWSAWECLQLFAKSDFCGRTAGTIVGERETNKTDWEEVAEIKRKRISTEILSSKIRHDDLSEVTT